MTILGILIKRGRGFKGGQWQAPERIHPPPFNQSNNRNPFNHKPKQQRMSLEHIDPAAGSLDAKSVANRETKEATVAGKGGVTVTTPSPVSSAPAAKQSSARRMEFHPLSNIFPMMGVEDLTKLAEDIAKHGLRESITTKDGKILDGRHRYLACQQVGVTPEFVKYDGDDLAAFVVSKNCHRRHLTKTERAAIAVELEEQFKAEAEKRKLAGRGADGSGGRGRKKGANLRAKMPGGLAAGSDQDAAVEQGRARAHSARAMRVSRKYVDAAASIKKQAPAVFEQMKAGKVSISDAKRQLEREKSAELPKEKGPKWLADAVKAVNGDRFDVIFTDEAGLSDATNGLRQNQIERLFSHIATPNAILLRIHELGEPVPIDIRHNWQGEQFLTTVVIEAADSKAGRFNLDVRHRLLAVYMLGDDCDRDTIPQPKVRIPSLHRTDDIFQLIATWLPDCKRLFLSDAPAPKGWTHLSPKKLAAARSKA